MQTRTEQEMRIQRVTDEMYEMLQSKTQDEEMFLGVVYAGGSVLMDETVQAADQDYVRITDGSCEHQALIPLADCLQATDLEPLIAPVLSWYVEAA